MTKICCVCSKVEEDGDWITDCVTSATKRFTHGYCPACYDDVMEDLGRIVNMRNSVRPPVVQGVSNYDIADVCA